MAIQKFTARPRVDCENELFDLPLARHWRLDGELERLFWQEGEELYSVDLPNIFDAFAVILKISNQRRVIYFDEEVWLLEIDARNLPVRPFQSYVENQLGVLLWDFTDAVWVSTDGVWELGRLAVDELQFSSISESGIAIGKGFDGSSMKMVRLDVMSKRVLD